MIVKCCRQIFHKSMVAMVELWNFKKQAVTCLLTDDSKTIIELEGTINYLPDGLK